MSDTAAVAQPVNSAASAVGPARQPVSLSNKKHEVSAYTSDVLVDSSGKEVSFEEVRAAGWFARQAGGKQQARAALTYLLSLCTLQLAVTKGRLHHPRTVNAL